MLLRSNNYLADKRLHRLLAVLTSQQLLAAIASVELYCKYSHCTKSSKANKQRQQPEPTCGQIQMHKYLNWTLSKLLA